MTVHFSRCILTPLSLPYAATWPCFSSDLQPVCLAVLLRAGMNLKNTAVTASSLLGSTYGYSDVLREAMGLFRVCGRLGQVLDPELTGTEWWPNVLWPRSLRMQPRRSSRHHPRSPAYQSLYQQLRAASRWSPGRALRSIQRASLSGRGTPAASASRRWMLPTVERGPPVHFSV